jgi:hypothetical protein
MTHGCIRSTKCGRRPNFRLEADFSNSELHTSMQELLPSVLQKNAFRRI